MAVSGGKRGRQRRRTRAGERLLVVVAGAGRRRLEAARVADAWRRDLAARGISFYTETVFSDPKGAKLEFLKECQSSGYTVIFVFIGLESAELSIGRVIQRVERGGHDVPTRRSRRDSPACSTTCARH